VTHLLQAALQEVLGEHVKQAGSLVETERMRFDFTHFDAMSDEELTKVEELVNRKIWENLPVSTSLMNLDEALKSGAMAEFGEKYEDTVRVVKAGEFSTELCGGTHVDNTGKIGIFKIFKESSPGAGTRRIEGGTLKSVYSRISELENLSGTTAALLNVSESMVSSKLEAVLAENSRLKKEVEKSKSDNLAGQLDSIIGKKEMCGDTAVISYTDKTLPAKGLRDLADMIRTKEQNSVVLLASEEGGKVMLLCAATKGAVDGGVDSGAVIKEVAPIVGGKGGGRKDMAQAGGKDSAKIADALTKGVELIKSQLA
jgi:alanyl-tRNA synthetase